jgi:hypothetical protein
MTSPLWVHYITSFKDCIQIVLPHLYINNVPKMLETYICDNFESVPLSASKYVLLVSTRFISTVCIIWCVRSQYISALPLWHGAGVPQSNPNNLNSLANWCLASVASVTTSCYGFVERLQIKPPNNSDDKMSSIGTVKGCTKEEL